jgi:hypothetical protein
MPITTQWFLWTEQQGWPSFLCTAPFLRGLDLGYVHAFTVEAKRGTVHMQRNAFIGTYSFFVYVFVYIFTSILFNIFCRSKIISLQLWVGAR